MQIFKFFLLLLMCIGSVLSQYNLLEDDRLSSYTRTFIYEAKTIHECSSTEEADDKLKFYQCLRSDETIESLKMKSRQFVDVGPMPLLQEWGDYLCNNTSKTVQCYRTYLNNLVKNCLDNNSSILNSQSLEPLEGILSVVCNENGVGMKPSAKRIVDCTEKNVIACKNCYVNGTGSHLDDLKSKTGFIPYLYEYSCRTLDATEKCVRKTTEEQCGLTDAAETEIITDLFRTMRNTQTCVTSANRSKRTFDERLYQRTELHTCPYNIIFDFRNFDSECEGLDLIEIQNEFESKYQTNNLSASMEKLCSTLPAINACSDTRGDLISSCIFSDVKHFGKQGFWPANKLLQHFCADYDANVAELVKSENGNCLMNRKDNVLKCLYNYLGIIQQKDVIMIPDLLYMDYENYENLKELQQCAPIALEGCDVKFISTITNAMQVVLDELVTNKFNYEM